MLWAGGAITEKYLFLLYIYWIIFKVTDLYNFCVTFKQKTNKKLVYCLFL